MGRDSYRDDEDSLMDRFFYCFRGITSIVGALLLFFALFYAILYLAFRP